ncbi:unnamed protein product, partial [Closterium sp. NIES-64]
MGSEQRSVFTGLEQRSVFTGSEQRSVFTVGSTVWVPDEEDAWAEGEVVGVKDGAGGAGGQVVVRTTGKKKREVVVRTTGKKKREVRERETGGAGDGWVCGAAGYVRRREEVRGGQAVEHTAGKKKREVTVAAGACYAREEDGGIMDDMVKMAYLHEPGVLSNLMLRYQRNLIY